jgi:thiamine-phosphate pyrophosphorylase
MRKNRAIDFRLYVITDRKLFSRDASLITAIKAALKGGVTAVQLREKDMETRELLRLAYRMRKVTEQFNAKLFINDRFDIALAVGADGVHLTQNSIPVDAVKQCTRRKLLAGVSTHSLKEAREAEKGGADFITFGPVYRTPSKLKYGSPVGIELLKNVSARAGIPVFAVGGVTQGRINDIKEAGAYGAAVIREVLASDDIKRTSGELVTLLGA